jgi:glycosyltransferase involved in cell wall biosynthesis
VATPDITVVVCTYNRAELVERTLQAVLDQAGPTLELVVVDDGSTDATPKVLAEIRDDRLRVLCQDNTGMSTARNAGLAVARGAWVVFLDDDDVPDAGWLRALTGRADDPGVGIMCCGATAVDPGGNVIAPMPPVPLPEPFHGVVASYRAGTFAARTELCRAAGGYLDGLGTSEQFELFMRLQAEATRQGLEVASTQQLALRVERRPVAERHNSNPYVMYDATTWILTRHPVTFGTAPTRVAAFEGVRGVAAARVDDWGTARRHFRASARLGPRRRRGWARLAIAYLPPVGRYAWRRRARLVYDPASVGVLAQRPERTAPVRELFLAWGYEENPPGEPAGAPTAGWERFLADRLVREHPGLVSRLDAALETADDPVTALHGIARDAAGADVLLATTDREVADPARPLGPPSNPNHRRQWSHDQFRLLLRSTGFRIERTWRKGERVVFLAGTKGP